MPKAEFSLSDRLAHSPSKCPPPCKEQVSACAETKRYMVGLPVSLGSPPYSALLGNKQHARGGLVESAYAEAQLLHGLCVCMVHQLSLPQRPVLVAGLDKSLMPVARPHSSDLAAACHLEALLVGAARQSRICVRSSSLKFLQNLAICRCENAVPGSDGAPFKGSWWPRH